MFYVIYFQSSRAHWFIIYLFYLFVSTPKLNTKTDLYLSYFLRLSLFKQISKCFDRYNLLTKCKINKIFTIADLSITEHRQTFFYLQISIVYNAEYMAEYKYLN